MWVILFTAKLLIINLLIVRLGRPSQKGVNKKIKIKIKNCLDKGALWAKGQVLKHPKLPSYQ